jgi:hypothetical protein
MNAIFVTFTVCLSFAVFALRKDTFLFVTSLLFFEMQNSLLVLIEQREREREF